MLPPKSIYVCRDIREIPREKVVAYARAIQHWAEGNNPPAGGGPQLLAESVLELREEVKWYLSFTNEDVFWGSGPPQEGRGGESKDPFCTADIPKAHHAPEPAPEKRAPKFMGWEKVLHPSQPVVACWADPPTIQGLEAKSRIKSTLLDDTHKASSLSTRGLPLHLNPPCQYRHWCSCSHQLCHCMAFQELRLVCGCQN